MSLFWNSDPESLFWNSPDTRFWYPDVTSVAYTYDTLGRLTQVTFPDGITIVYNYDVMGNRTSVITTFE